MTWACPAHLAMIEEVKSSMSTGILWFTKEQKDNPDKLGCRVAMENEARKVDQETG